MLVLEGLVHLHRTVQLQLFNITGWGIDLDYSDIEWFALEMNRDHFVIFEVASKYPLTVWITTNYGKFLKRREYQTTWPASWEIFMQVKKQKLELDMEQQTGSKLRKEYFKAVYCHSAYLSYIQSTSCEIQGWMKHKLE